MSKQALFVDCVHEFEMYRTLDSLTDYLLVAQDEPLVEHYTRLPDNRWVLSEHKGMDAVVAIASIDCTLPLADIYDKIDFDSDQPVLRLVKEPVVDYSVEAMLTQAGFSPS